MDLELEHFSHGHPLLLSDHQDQKDDGGEEIPCAGCLLPLSSGGGPTYNCIQCKYFLHKSCAELPHKIIHFLHPRHPLTLLSKVSGPEKRNHRVSKCDNCAKKILGFTYQCSLCNFYLDIKCASLLDIVQAEGHKHSFMLLKPMKVNIMTCICDACGKGIKGMSYLCTTCQFLVHERCLTITKTIKLIGHPHQLDLSYFAPGNQSCNICKFKIKKSFLFYSCSVCTYTAHLRCATLEDLRDAAFVLKDENQESIPFDPIPNRSETNIDSTITQDVSTINLKENQIAAELEHFSHPHVLVLGKNDPEECDKKNCDGCSWPIFDLPFYSCSQCNFHLHKACADLPHKISHLLHPHPLTLRLDEPNEVNIHGTFECNGCETTCNGFAYCCDMCNFSIDVRCSLLTATLEHKIHPHTLRFFRHDKYPVYCEGCSKGYVTKFFGCGEGHPELPLSRRFRLDLRCATLPYTTKHRCPKHNWEFYPFHLTFGFEKDTYDSTCYCDVCEERRIWRDLFYYCEDCDYSAHPSCVLSNYLKKPKKF